MLTKMSLLLLLAVTIVGTISTVAARSIAFPLNHDDQPTPFDADDVATRDRDDVIVKRSAPYVDELLQRMQSGGDRVMTRRRRRSSEESDPMNLLSDNERRRMTDLLTNAIILRRLQHHDGTHGPRAEVWGSAGLDHDDDVWLQRQVDRLMRASVRRTGKRSYHGMQLRSPRELHPVYLGLGQDAASAALDTYASLLADEKRRESLEQQQQGSANPVRFIGKKR